MKTIPLKQHNRKVQQQLFGDRILWWIFPLSWMCFIETLISFSYCIYAWVSYPKRITLTPEHIVQTIFILMAETE